MESRGMVVKIKGKSCIVLTPEGEYREVPLPKSGAVRAGQEIPLEKRKSLPYLRHFMVAASLLIFILAGQLYLGQTPPAAAYLTIDINPSVELAVSKDKRVISARGLNSDGEKILAEVKIKRRDLCEAVELIIAQAETDQYLREKEDNVILATLTVDSDAEPVVDLNAVYEAIKKPVESGGVDAEVIIEPVKPEMRQEAARSGISTGRYLLIQRSGKKGVPISVSEISAMSLGKLEKEKKVSFIELVDEDNSPNRDNVDIGLDDGENGDRKEVKVVKKGIYIERHNIKEDTEDKPDGKVVISDKKQENGDNLKKSVPERTVKKQKEEKQDGTERQLNNAGKRKTNDIDSYKHEDDDYNRDGNHQQGHRD